MTAKRLTRRQFVARTAAAGAALTAAPYMQTAHSAGKLAIGLWDHWVPGALDIAAQCYSSAATPARVGLRRNPYTRARLTRADRPWLGLGRSVRPAPGRRI